MFSSLLCFLRPLYYDKIIESSAERERSIEQETVLLPGSSPSKRQFGSPVFLAALHLLPRRPHRQLPVHIHRPLGQRRHPDGSFQSCAAVKIFPALCIKGPPCVNATHGGPFSQIPPGKSAHRWRAAAISAAAAPFWHGKEV